MKTKSTFLTLLVFCILSQAGRAQIPVNDDYTGAVAMSISAACSAVAGSTFKCTQSLPQNLCAGELPYTVKDLWYKFVTDGSFSIDVKAKPASGILVLALYASTADESGYVSCTNSLGDGVAQLKMGMLPSGTYYYRVYAANSVGIKFNTCVLGVVPVGPLQKSSDSNSYEERFSEDSGLIPGTLTVHPNPSTGLVSVGFFAEASGPYNLMIQDQVGNRIKAMKNFSVAGWNRVEIDLTGDGPGIYNIIATGSVINASVKAIVQ